MPHSLFTRHAKPRSVAIHQDLLDICDGQHCAAALLGQIERLCNHQERLYSQDGGVTCSHLIFSRSFNELSDMVLGLYSSRTIRDSMAWMTHIGFLKKLDTPEGDFSAWKLNLEAVNLALASASRAESVSLDARTQSRALLRNIAEQEASQ